MSSMIKESSFADSVGDPSASRKKNDDLPPADLGFEDDVEDLNSFSSSEISADDLRRLNRDLRMELQRLQHEHHEELASRDEHIKVLESRLISMRQSTTHSSPPQDSERAALLQEKLNKAVSHLKPLIEENKALVSRVSELEEERSRLNDQLSRSTSNLGKEAVDDYTEKYNFIKSHAESLEKTVAEMNEKELELLDEIRSLQDVNEQKSVTIDQLRETNAALEQKLHSSSHQIESEDKEAERSNFEAELASLRSQLEDASLGSSRTSNLLQEALTRRSELEAELQDARRMLMLREKDVAELEEKAASVESLTASLQTLESEVQQAGRKIGALETALNDSTQHRKDLEQFIAELERERDELKTQMIGFEKGQADVISQASSKQVEIEQLKKEANEIKVRLEESINQLKEQEAQLTAEKHRNLELQNELDSIRDKAEDSSSAFSLNEIMLEKAKLEALVRQLQDDRSAHDEDASAGKHLENFRQFCLSLAKGDFAAEPLEISPANSSLEGLQGTVNEIAQSLNSILGTLRIKEGVEKELKATIQSLERLTEDLNTEIQEKADALMVIGAEMSSVKEEKDRITSEHAVLVEKLTTVKASILPKLQAEMDESNRLRSEVETLNTQLSTLREERALLKAEMALLANSDAQLRDISSQTSAETQRLQAELQAAREELSSVNNDLDKCQRRLLALQQHMAESEEANTQEALKLEATLSEYKIRVDSLERERENWEDMARESHEAVRVAEERLLEARAAEEKSREAYESIVRAREKDQISLANLQSVLEEFQAGLEPSYPR
ncbi:hypothetical protein HDU96_008386 [Phlyctochytrium bullatum]|nr:hypothetical protein HDU96_008386 [Phlyctochytrium bullatum]